MQQVNSAFELRGKQAHLHKQLSAASSRREIASSDGSGTPSKPAFSFRSLRLASSISQQNQNLNFMLQLFESANWRLHGHLTGPHAIVFYRTKDLTAGSTNVRRFDKNEKNMRDSIEIGHVHWVQLVLKLIEHRRMDEENLHTESTICCIVKCLIYKHSAAFGWSNRLKRCNKPVWTIARFWNIHQLKHYCFLRIICCHRIITSCRLITVK